MKRRTFPFLAERYIKARLICTDYESQIRRVATACGSVTVERVNAYLQTRSEEVSSLTVKNERGHLLTLWKFGFQTGLLDAMPRGVMTVKVVRQPVKAWTREQLQHLLRHLATLHQRMRRGPPQGLYLKTWVLLGYETGARLGDLMAFSRGHLDGDSIAWTQSKTGDPMVRVLSGSCQESVGKMLELSPDGRIIGWVATKRQATRVMSEAVAGAGLSGTGKWLRRSGATHCEMERPGAGRLHLGHRSPALFEQAYCDWAQMRTRTPVVPELQAG